MKKLKRIALVTILLLSMAFGGLYATLSSNEQQHPIQAQSMPIAPLNDIWEPPYEVMDGNIYAAQGQRIFLIRETGMIITEDGVPLADGDSNMVVYCEVNDEFINSANRSLSIFLDSRINRRYLRDGSRVVTAINMNREVVKINYTGDTQGGRVIYAFLNRTRRSAWQIFTAPNSWWNSSQRYDYHFFAAACGTQIPNRDIGQLGDAMFWNSVAGNTVVAGITALNPALGIAMFLTGTRNIPMYQILDRTTLRDLKEIMSHATVHPWATLKCGQTNKDLVTEDGMTVRVNPRTNQLHDFFGFALFNRVTFMPIIFHNNDIITADREQQKVENAVLLYAVTTQRLLAQGEDFYIAHIATDFGIFEKPVLYDGNGGWLNLGGQNVDDLILPMTRWTQPERPASVPFWTAFFGWWRDLIVGFFNMLVRHNIHWWILGIWLALIVIVVAIKTAPLWSTPFFKGMWAIISAPGVMIAKAFRR